MSITGVITVEGVLVDGDVLEVQNAAIWLLRFVEREWSTSRYPAEFGFAQPDALPGRSG